MVKMANATSTGVATGSEGLTCFVCDVGVIGKYYPLATCRTQTSKIRLIEKLGQLVGDEYMVVISQDDIICRGCATMINSLDRLEKELSSLRSVVLRYLEKKYDMDEGELVNTRSNPNIGLSKEKGSSAQSQANDFQARKRRMMGNDIVPEEIRSAGKDSAWLQCDKCKYTTNYGSFMTHHARSHNKKKEHAAQQQGAQVIGGTGQNILQQQQQQQILVQGQQQMELHEVVEQATGQQNGEQKPNILTIQRLGDSTGETIIAGEIGEASKGELEGNESVEMITADISQEFVEGGDKNNQMLTMVEVDNKVTLQEVEGEDGNTLCMVDENGIILQKVEQAEDGTLYVRVPDSSETKQVLSVADDGSVQMVEVLWDDMGEMVAADETEGHGWYAFPETGTGLQGDVLPVSSCCLTNSSALGNTVSCLPPSCLGVNSPLTL